MAEEDDSYSAFIGFAHGAVAVALVYGCSRRCCAGRSAAPGASAPQEEAGRDNSVIETEHLQPQKCLTTGYLLLLGAGALGAHHFYLERLVHGLLCLWTVNFLGVGLLVDLLCLPRYVRNFNTRRCSPAAPGDASRGRLLCRLPLVLVSLLACVFAGFVLTPSMLHKVGVVDIDRIKAQTEANPYDVLGVSRAADLAEAKAAYRKESLRWHPDRNPGCGKPCGDRMAEIGKAFDLIKKRKAPTPTEATWQGWIEDTLQDWSVVVEALAEHNANAASAEAKAKGSEEL